MRKLTLLLLLAVFSFSAHATHLMGGEITVKQVPGNKYIITLSYYRDTLGVPLSTSELVDIYAAGSVSGGGYGLIMPNVPLHFDTALSLSLVPSFPYGVQTGVYLSDSLSLPTGGILRIVSYTCCRNGAILNASNPLGESLVLYTDLSTAGGNSSPKFLAMPIAHFAIGTPTTYNPLPFDPDLDSVAWDYNVPIGNYSSSGGVPTLTPVLGYIPLQSTSSFTMNPVTGEITWTPTVTGNFINSFKVMEYKAGVHTSTIIRDMQYVVLPADTNNPPPNFAMVSPYMVNTAQQYNYAYYTPGQQFIFQINATASGNGSTLTMNGYGEPFQMTVPATFMSSRSGNTLTGTFKWTPTAGLNRDVIVMFRAGNGVFTKDFTLVLKKNPSTTGVSNTTTAVNSFTVFPNPVKDELSVSLNLNNNIQGKVLIYNTIGQIVKTVYEGPMNKGTLRLTTPVDLPSGSYFVVLKDAGGTIATKGVVVQ